MSTSNFAAPGQQRYLRACMVCSIVMTYSVRLASPRLTLPGFGPVYPVAPLRSLCALMA